MKICHVDHDRFRLGTSRSSVSKIRAVTLSDIRIVPRYGRLIDKVDSDAEMED